MWLALIAIKGILYSYVHSFSEFHWFTFKDLCFVQYIYRFLNIISRNCMKVEYFLLIYVSKIIEIFIPTTKELKSKPCKLPFFGGPVTNEFFNGQQTNSTPENTSIPQGKSIAKLLTFIPRPLQAFDAVVFHISKSQHLVWLWMWSKRQCSGTKRASLWKGPAM